jgi:hypothetical protein
VLYLKYRPGLVKRGGDMKVSDFEILRNLDVEIVDDLRGEVDCKQAYGLRSGDDHAFS